MGNLALKCEARWQTRKIDGTCVGGTLEVRVMRTDGTEAEEFDRPVVAAEVMHQFPDYVVVRWCPKRITKLEKRGQLSVLRPHEVLTPGEIYVLVPIPDAVAKANNLEMDRRRSRRIRSSKERLSLLLKRAAQASEPLELPKQDDNDSCKDDHRDFPGFSSRWEADPANSSGEIEESLQETLRTRKLTLQPPCKTWTPELVSIPESPVGFHSWPGSPKTPIAFRLVSKSGREQV